jgi:alkanesulfonate monooxygenase SsuD/methylene tetrahydromethanopterin reductase-like flavin-dependent oxidoreductase (luciferase family)
MKFGLALPYVDPLTAVRYARRAEEAGWDGVFMGDAIWCLDPMIALAAVAVQTSRIRLGTMITPVPLRKPWKIASEAAALDHASNGRMTLGLGAGAVWMGWQAFPSEATDKKARAEMLDETVDLLTLLFAREPFDYDGKHFPTRLTLLDQQHYPTKPIQQPRIPLWVVGVWPRKSSMGRVLKADGLLPNKINAAGQFEAIMPADVREMRDFVTANRTATTPFDIIIEEQSLEWEKSRIQEKLGQWEEAGATWWIEGLWGADDAKVFARIEKGIPSLE